MIPKLSLRQMFLLDGIGALLTAISPLALLAVFGNIFQMPVNILYVLSGIAALYALYSLSCYALPLNNRKPFLRGIMVANIAYCCLTLGLVLYYWSTLTGWGKVYFLGEIGIVLRVVFWEKEYA
jgi:uncharacterized membrane protein YuzA (DUF378 family)